MVAGGTLYSKRGHKRLRKLVSDGVSAPDLAFNDKQISYARGGRVYARRIGGGARHFGVGADPTSDGGRPAGKIRHTAYERGGASSGSPSAPASAGSAPAPCRR